MNQLVASLQRSIPTLAAKGWSALGEGRFDQARNGLIAWRGFRFATTVGDFEAAWEMERRLSGPMRYRSSPDLVRRATNDREAHLAASREDYEEAERRLSASLEGREAGDRDRLMLIFLRNLRTSRHRGNASEVSLYEDALKKLLGPP